MPELVIILSDPPWTDLTEEALVTHLTEPVQMALRPGHEGDPTIAIRMNLPDGKVVIGETPLANFFAAALTFDTHIKRMEG